MEAYFVAVWQSISGGIAALFLITLFDVIAGVLEAIIHKHFEWQCLMHFLENDVVPIFAWVVIVMLKLIPAILLPSGYTIPVVSEVVYGFIFLSIIGSIFKSFGELGVLTDLFGRIGVLRSQ